MRLANRDRAFESILAPSRRASVNETLNLIADPATSAAREADRGNEPAMDELLDTLERGILAQVAGEGFVDTSGRGKNKSNKGQPMIKRTNAIQSSDDMEQDLLEVLSYRKGLDYAENPAMDRAEVDQSNPLVQQLTAFINNAVPAGVSDIGSGGVGKSPKGSRPAEMIQNYSKGQQQFEQKLDEVAEPATVKFLAQNLMGNSIGEQPVFTSHHGNQGGLPIEHMHTPFNTDPSKGLDVDNRDLGSRLKNSTLGDKPAARAQELLTDSLEKLILNFESDYGMSIQDAMDTYAMDYRPGQRAFPDIFKPRL